MTYAFVQKVSNSTPSASTLAVVTADIGANPTTGNLFFYVVNYSAVSLTTVAITDLLGNSAGFTQIGQQYDSSAGDALHWGYCKNITGGGIDAFTATFGTLIADPAIYIAEYSGFDTTAPFHTGEFSIQLQTTPGTGANAISSGNTPALSAQPAGLIGVCLAQNTGNQLSAGTALSFTSRGAFWDYANDNDGGGTNPFFALIEDVRLTATTAAAATFSGTAGASDSYMTVAVVFKEQAAAAPIAAAWYTC